MSARTLTETIAAAKAVANGMSQDDAAQLYRVSLRSIRRELRRIGVADMRCKSTQKEVPHGHDFRTA